MAGMKIKPWERVVTDIRLVPKLIILMVFSTVLLIGKQLWDAHTFYQSVVSVQIAQAQDISQAEAKFLDDMLSHTGKAEIAEQAFLNMAGENDKQHYSYLIQLDTGRVLGLRGGLFSQRSVSENIRRPVSVSAYPECEDQSGFYSGRWFAL